jgi:hypothetical protein
MKHVVEVPVFLVYLSYDSFNIDLFVYANFLQNDGMSNKSSNALLPNPPHSRPFVVVTKPVPPPPLENAFFATMESNDAKEISPGTPPKKINTVPTLKTISSATVDDWSKLPLSAVKRKPISEIMSYLQAKGRDVIDKNGRPLSKSQLVDAIFSF